MLIFENIALAFSSLRANKMRSLLTMLGIIIGIGSVIAIITVGNSLTKSMTSSMSSMGANNITVGLMQKSTNDDVMDDGMVFRGPADYREPTGEDFFKDEVIDAYREKFIDDIRAISFEENAGNGQVVIGSDYANVNVLGVNQEYFDANKVELVAGNLLSQKAIDGGKSVAVVSSLFVDNLFGGDMDAAIGEQVEVDIGSRFFLYTIVGVYKYEESGYDMTSTKERATIMYVPIQSAQHITHNTDGYRNFVVMINDYVDNASFLESTSNFFQAYYRDNDYFEVNAFSMQSFVNEWTSMMGTVQLAISFIAGISLLVGGIGVMNIMMVSISERTREIGTRKALGATNGSIRLQFIVEAMVICLIGGIFGILLGVGGGAAGAKAMGYAASPSMTSIVGSVLFSLVIGVFFGFYPANKAAKMNPIDALRYE